MKHSTTFVLSVIFFLGIINLSQAIMCYVCNSRDPSLEGSKPDDFGSYCVDPFNVSSTPVDLVDCDTIRDVTTNPKTNYTDELPNVCVKMVTLGSKVTENRKSEVVTELTSRLCGHTTKGDRCSNSDGARSETTRCYCSEDGCNAGPGLFVPAMSTLLMLAAAILILHGK